MRALAAAMVLLLAAAALPLTGAQCVATAGTCVNVETSFTPGANATVAPPAAPDSSVAVSSDAPVLGILILFEGPSAAFEYKHMAIPTVKGDIVLFDVSARATYSGMCMQVPGAGACVPFLV